MDILRYVYISMAGLLIGVAVGSVGGLSITWLLALGYHRRGPSDPGDAPVYVALGLTLLGALLGAIIGTVVGIIVSLRERRKSLNLRA